MSIQLILGGARSGKSSFAERMAIEIANTTNKQLVYIATATADDVEMQQRISQHQDSRQSHKNSWLLIEQPLELAQALSATHNNQCVLIDCLTLWISNCLHNDCWLTEKSALLKALETCDADIIMVSNEVGSGIVPMGELSRKFVDESGWLHQQLALLCDQVTLVVAGLPLPLKS